MKIIWKLQYDRLPLPGKPGNPGKTGFFKISPGKHWKQCTFQDEVSGKSGKNYSVIIA